MAVRFLKLAIVYLRLGIVIGLANAVRNIGSARKGKPSIARPPSLHISEWK